MLRAVSAPRLLLLALVPVAAMVALSGPAGALAVALPLLLFAPGYLALGLLWPDAPPALPVRAALWMALSLSLIALLFLWITTLGLALPVPVLAGLAIACALGAGWRLWHAAAGPLGGGPGGWQRWLAPGLLLVVLGLTLWTRFNQIHGLALPPWVDSLHHALLIRVAAERGQAPLSLDPYLPVEQLPYHWGYHVFCAALLQLSGAELPDLMLWSGQILGALAALAAAGLAHYLWRNALAGVAAALVVGLVSIMPAYYLSWGRYTLLLGVLMLPATLIAVAEAARTPDWRRVLAAALLLAGLSLVHFIVFVFALLWCVAALLVYAPGGQGWIRAPLGLLGAGLLVGALTAPWLLLLAGRARPGTGISATHVAGNAVYNAMPAALLWAGNNQLLLALAGGSALLALLLRRRAAAALLLWGLLAVVAANPVWLGLPYLSFVTNEMIAITLFLPVAALIGGGAALLDDLLRGELPARLVATWTPLRSVALAGLALWCAWGFQSVIRSDTVLAGANDRAAIAWAAANTPPDARFLVNTAGWLGNVDRGADGGWWLLPLAGRQVSTPPVVYTYAADTFVRQVKHGSSWLRKPDQRSPTEIAAFMRDNGYGYVYATDGARLLSPERLLGSGLFDELHRAGTISLLRLRDADQVQ
ncbi:MAG: hypothetical protein OHK0022_29700 [Roseiflexaceae bacterium]